MPKNSFRNAFVTIAVSALATVLPVGSAVSEVKPTAQPKPGEALSCALEGGGYGLYCRGPLGVVPTWGMTYLHMRAASTAAGANGENLKPGECSWPDRPFRKDEGRYIILRWLSYDYKPPASATAQQFFGTMFANCLSSETCVFRTCIKGVDATLWEMKHAPDRTYYPFVSTAPKCSTTGKD